MLRLSRYPFSTMKTPVSVDNRGTELLIRAGFIRQELAGAYHFLPLGLAVLQRITQIVREEMNSIGAHELLMSALGSREHWTATGRWDTLDVLFRVPASGDREYALNATHEEMVTPIMTEFLRSYRDMDYPVIVYQFQSKFRNEARAKSGILRGREFLMKDAYSFHRSPEELDVFFEEVRHAYDRVFDRLGLGAITHYTFASGGSFSKYSYEFQTELGIGEDTVYICDACGQSHNDEIVENGVFKCVECGHASATTKVVSEVANIFKLGTKFSAPFNMKYADEKGANNGIYMGCYGIGVSRLMGVIAEAFADDRGLVWPENVAPYSHIVLDIGSHPDQVAALVARIESTGGTVIVDDRAGP